MKSLFKGSKQKSVRHEQGRSSAAAAYDSRPLPRPGPGVSGPKTSPQLQRTPTTRTPPNTLVVGVDFGIHPSFFVRFVN